MNNLFIIVIYEKTGIAFSIQFGYTLIWRGTIKGHLLLTVQNIFRDGDPIIYSIHYTDHNGNYLLYIYQAYP